MASAAHCPHCDHEFLVPTDTACGARTTCPACDASFPLPDERTTDNPLVRGVDAGKDASADNKVDDPTSSADDAEVVGSRIEKWFRSADTVPDSPAGGLRFSVYGSPADTPLVDEGLPTVNTGGRSPAFAHNPLVKTEPVAPAQAKPTWDDAEHMERLLADLEAQPTADDSPARRELPNHRALPAAVACDAAKSASDGNVSIRPRYKARPRTSLARSAAATLVAGVVGLMLGGYALLWILGPRGDIVGIAKYMPNLILPASFRETSQLAVRTPPDAEIDRREISPDHPTIAESARQSGSGAAAEITADFQQPAGTMPNGGRAGAVERVRNRPVEPARFDEPAATPAAVAGQVAGARSYTNDQLAAMLRAAHEALPGLVTGDLNDPAVQRTKGVSYQRLCDLAEAVTFAQQPVVSGGAMSSAGQEEDAAQALFRETLREPKVRGEVARIAPLWIATPQRRHGGVFFAGSVVSSAQRGPVMECRVETGAGEPIIILVPAALREQLDRADGALAIVGSLVDQPSDHVAGYTGSAPQAVWVGMLIPLD